MAGQNAQWDLLEEHRTIHFEPSCDSSVRSCVTGIWWNVLAKCGSVILGDVTRALLIELRTSYFLVHQQEGSEAQLGMIDSLLFYWLRGRYSNRRDCTRQSWNLQWRQNSILRLFKVFPCDPVEPSLAQITLHCSVDPR